jgi:hypothetical protein
MKHLIPIAALAVVVGASTAQAQQGGAAQGAAAKQGGAAQPGAAGGHTAPKAQPTTAPEPADMPAGDLALGSINLNKAVKADGKPLAAGTYQLRLTGQQAAPDAIGQTEAAARWVEFVRGGKVVAREVVTIVPQAEINLVQKDAPPARNGAKVETLRGGDYVRVWINRGGNHYLIHLPV